MKGLVARLQDHARFDTVTSCSNMSQVCVRVIPTRSTTPEWRPSHSCSARSHG